MWKKILLGWLTATAVALFFAAQMKVSAATAGRPQSWGQVLYWGFGDWYEWAALTPMIFWLAGRFRFRAEKRIVSVAVHLASGITFSIVHAAMCAGAAVLQQVLEGTTPHFWRSFQGLLANRLHFNLAVYALLVAAWQALLNYREKRTRELEAQRLTEELSWAQLQALRMQLNPHFLFNALNTVSSLMLKDVKAANRMLCRIGELLRLALNTTDQQEVPLKQELEFLKRYVEIEQIRFGDQLQLKMEVDPATLEAIVPNMMLQPLVENAIRYAVEPSANKGEIELRCGRENGSLSLEISDKGPGTGRINAVEENGAASRARIGLKNIRQRLEKLYGEKHGFELRQNANGGMTVSLLIPFRLSPVSPAGL